MNPSRILPDLQCSLLCEDVRQEATGNFILIGVVNFIRVPQLPVAAFKLCLFNRWTAGYGQFRETVRLIAPDQTTVLRQGEMKFALQEVTHNATTVSVWGQVKFEIAGAYFVEVMVDDVMKLRFPLVISAAPPTPPAEGGARKAAMNPPAEGAQAPPAAWQPFTFGGVAAFAGARIGRLLAAEFGAAIIVAACAVWFLHRAYCPVILQAIQKMPDTARVANGTLQGMPDTLIAESKFLAIAAKPQSASAIGQDADLQIQLRQHDVSAGSVFWPDWGLEFDYERGPVLNLGRSTLEPWWSAWKPVLLIGTAAGTVLFLLMVWLVLATIYMAPAKFIAWFADRYLTWGGAWRLALAALLPGTLVLAGAIILYGWSVIDLVGLSFFAGVHAILGWVYLFGAACKVTRLFPDQSKRNPFTA